MCAVVAAAIPPAPREGVEEVKGHLHLRVAGGQRQQKNGSHRS